MDLVGVGGLMVVDLVSSLRFSFCGGWLVVIGGSCFFTFFLGGLYLNTGAGRVGGVDTRIGAVLRPTTVLGL